MEIILGPPGTGKTTRLVGIVEEELARGVSPDRVAYVSFTRRAADEAAGRACEKFHLERSQMPWFRTLHSLCFRWLGLKSADVLEGSRLQEFADYAGVRVTRRWSEDGTLAGYEIGDRVLFMENLARVRGVTLRQQYEEDADEISWSVVQNVAGSLVKFKRAHGLVDYTDMLTQFVEQAARLRLEVLIVDESQDNSALQWNVVRQLAAGCRRVAVAGDDDQAIYRWAGADVDQFVDMRGDVSVLGQSWRVPRAVQRVAAGVIGRVRRRRPKEWAARDEEGAVERAAAFSRVDVAGEDVLVLARNVYVLKEQIEPELRAAGVVYERNGRSSIPEGMLGAVETWERLRRGESVAVPDARQTYEFLSSRRGVKHGHKKLPGFDEESTVTIAELRERGGLLADGPWFEALDRLPREDVEYVRRARSRGERLRGRPRVRVSTIHGSKGGQADHVVLMTEMAKRTHREMEASPEDEARVFYVAATRAKERLTIVSAQTSQFYPI